MLRRESRMVKLPRNYECWFWSGDHAPFSRVTEAKRASIDDVDMAPWKQADSFYEKPI